MSGVDRLPIVPFRWPVRVYWEDTDAGGVVFYANYLKFFERARTEWLRALGHGQEALRAGSGIVFVVTETSARYLRPARLDDLLDVTVEPSAAGRAQLSVVQRAWKRTTVDPGRFDADPGRGPSEPGGTGGPHADSPHRDRRESAPAGAELLCEGTIRIACVEAGTFRPCRIPPPILASVATDGSPFEPAPAPPRRLHSA